MKTLHTHNARYETVTQSPLYRPCLANGRRCIVLAEGYYEWQTTPGENNKQPYYLYQEPSSKLRAEECKEKDEDEVEESEKAEEVKEEEKPWKGKNLIKFAGIFNKTSENVRL